MKNLPPEETISLEDAADNIATLATLMNMPKGQVFWHDLKTMAERKQAIAEAMRMELRAQWCRDQLKMQK